MSLNRTTWKKINDSLGYNDDVNISQLTSYIEDLYDRIRDLESQLDQEEEYRQRQHD
jgi:hypothetical protein